MKISKDNITYDILIVDNKPIINIEVYAENEETKYFWMSTPTESENTLEEDAIEYLVSVHSFKKGQ